METSRVKMLARKWYETLPFPEQWDLQFGQILEKEEDLPEMKIVEYDAAANKGAVEKNLIYFLYFCEEVQRKYLEKGISEKILLDTLGDFVICVERCISTTGRFGLAGTGWMIQHLNLRLFRLGRLQFCMDGCYQDIPEIGLKKGDNVLDVHIPRGESLKPELYRESFAMAEQFFAKFFPEYQYEYYTCFSWMLDDVLHNFLKESSNILQFASLFTVADRRPMDSILHFMFKYGIQDREELRECGAATEFARKVKEYALSGGVFYNTLGYRRRT